MENLVDLHTIHKLEERYPFNEEELEILVRCHEHVRDEKDKDGFLVKLALASPYAFFFLPGPAMKERVTWIEDHILPPGFGSNLRSAISTDAFVEYANQGENKSLERFLEGIADTGRRGSKESLKVLYNLLYEPDAHQLMDVCVRLAVASYALAVPNLDKKAALLRLEKLQPTMDSLTSSLVNFCEEDKPLSREVFSVWAEDNFPMLSAPLCAFVHELLFHGQSFPKERFPYNFPVIEEESGIFDAPHSAEVATLSFAAPQLGGKWRRLYSSYLDGRSFNRMEWSVLGYSGPTFLLLKTTTNCIIGGFTKEPWKESKSFYGSSESFLFELAPELKVYRPVGKEDHFMYLHTDFYRSPLATKINSSTPRGLGFGGTVAKPRLFIPESFENCTAGFLDKTFQEGNLLPTDNLEKFQIKSIEVWGVGGEESISKALRDRADHRERTNTVIEQARMVLDKTAFAKDLQSGLIPGSKIFAHDKVVRGRQEFRVDEEHGGYKLDH